MKIDYNNTPNEKLIKLCLHSGLIETKLEGRTMKRQDLIDLLKENAKMKGKK